MEKEGDDDRSAEASPPKSSPKRKRSRKSHSSAKSDELVVRASSSSETVQEPPALLKPVKEEVSQQAATFDGQETKNENANETLDSTAVVPQAEAKKEEIGKAEPDDDDHFGPLGPLKRQKNLQSRSCPYLDTIDRYDYIKFH